MWEIDGIEDFSYIGVNMVLVVLVVMVKVVVSEKNFLFYIYFGGMFIIEFLVLIFEFVSDSEFDYYVMVCDLMEIIDVVDVVNGVFFNFKEVIVEGYLEVIEKVSSEFGFDVVLGFV